LSDGSGPLSRLLRAPGLSLLDATLLLSLRVVLSSVWLAGRLRAITEATAQAAADPAAAAALRAEMRALTIGVSGLRASVDAVGALVREPACAALGGIARALADLAETAAGPKGEMQP